MTQLIVKKWMSECRYEVHNIFLVMFLFIYTITVHNTVDYNHNIYDQ